MPGGSLFKSKKEKFDRLIKQAEADLSAAKENAANQEDRVFGLDHSDLRKVEKSFVEALKLANSVNNIHEKDQCLGLLARKVEELGQLGQSSSYRVSEELQVPELTRDVDDIYGSSFDLYDYDMDVANDTDVAKDTVGVGDAVGNTARKGDAGSSEDYFTRTAEDEKPKREEFEALCRQHYLPVPTTGPEWHSAGMLMQDNTRQFDLEQWFDALKLEEHKTRERRVCGESFQEHKDLPHWVVVLNPAYDRLRNISADDKLKQGIDTQDQGNISDQVNACVKSLGALTQQPYVDAAQENVNEAEDPAELKRVAINSGGNNGWGQTFEGRVRSALWHAQVQLTSDNISEVAEVVLHDGLDAAKNHLISQCNVDTDKADEFSKNSNLVTAVETLDLCLQTKMPALKKNYSEQLQTARSKQEEHVSIKSDSIQRWHPVVLSLSDYVESRGKNPDKYKNPDCPGKQRWRGFGFSKAVKLSAALKAMRLATLNANGEDDSKKEEIVFTSKEIAALREDKIGFKPSDLKKSFKQSLPQNLKRMRVADAIKEMGGKIETPKQRKSREASSAKAFSSS